MQAVGQTWPKDSSCPTLVLLEHFKMNINITLFDLPIKFHQYAENILCQKMASIKKQVLEHSLDLYNTGKKFPKVGLISGLRHIQVFTAFRISLLFLEGDFQPPTS